MDEGEQFEKIEAREVRIAEPLPNKRSIEDDVRSLGCPRDRLAAARFPDFSFGGEPDPRMGCVERGDGERVHIPTLSHKRNVWGTSNRSTLNIGDRPHRHRLAARLTLR